MATRDGHIPSHRGDGAAVATGGPWSCFVPGFVPAVPRGKRGKWPGAAATVVNQIRALGASVSRHSRTQGTSTAHRQRCQRADHLHHPPPLGRGA